MARPAAGMPMCGRGRDSAGDPPVPGAGRAAGLRVSAGRRAAPARGGGAVARGRGLGCAGSCLLLGGGRAGAEHVPVVPVQVAEASSVEEALVIRLIRGQGTCREGLAGEFVDVLPAVDLQLHDHLARGGGIRDLLFGGGRELRLVYQQDVDVIADDEGRHGLVRQLVVRGEAQCREKTGGRGEVFDREVDSNLGGHRCLRCRGGWLLLVEERREWKCERRCLHVVPLPSPNRCAAWGGGGCQLGGAGLDPPGSRIRYGTVPGGPGTPASRDLLDQACKYRCWW